MIIHVDPLSDVQLRAFVKLNMAIVMTGTIIPNTKVSHFDWRQRRKEYIHALKYYTKFAPVFFLENSSYDILNDEEFMAIENVVYRKFQVEESDKLFIKSLNGFHGMGYQEFQMLDIWMLNEPYLPKYWFKISGRYIVANMPLMIKDCCNKQYDLIMDVFWLYKWAVTYFFYISSEYYRTTFLNKYKECVNEDIEKVLYSTLNESNSLNIHFFNHEPVISAISGGNGKRIIQKSGLKLLLVNLCRIINKLVSSRRLIYFNPQRIMRALWRRI